MAGSPPRGLVFASSIARGCNNRGPHPSASDNILSQLLLGSSALHVDGALLGLGDNSGRVDAPGMRQARVARARTGRAYSSQQAAAFDWAVERRVSTMCPRRRVQIGSSRSSPRPSDHLNEPYQPEDAKLSPFGANTRTHLVGPFPLALFDPTTPKSTTELATFPSRLQLDRKLPQRLHRAAAFEDPQRAWGWSA